MPSMVTLDSATLVERMIFRFDDWPTARSCSAGGRSPCSGTSARSLLGRELGAGLHRAPDLGGARQEDEHVAVEPRVHERAHRGGDLEIELPIVRRGEMLDGDVEALALRAHDAAPEERRDGAGIERRRHRDDAKVGPRRLLHAPEERERDVALEVTLVELVEEHGRHAAKERVGEQPSREDALGHEAHARSRARRVLEANRVADGLADALAELVGDAPCREPRGEASWLEHDDLAGERPGVEHRARDAGRLAGAGRRLEHERGRGGERAKDVREDRIDGEGGERQAGTGKCETLASRALPGLMGSVRVVENVPLASMTTLRLGGPARAPDRARSRAGRSSMPSARSTRAGSVCSCSAAAATSSSGTTASTARCCA